MNAWPRIPMPLALFALVAASALAVGAKPERPLAKRAAACTIVGTAKAEPLRATPSRDVICARGGNDRILRLEGGDVVRGGRGRDTASWAGSRRGMAIDLVRGTAVPRGVRGAAKDRLSGIENAIRSRKRDVITAGNGSHVSAGRGDDRVNGGGGAGNLAGGAGEDTISYAAASARMRIDLDFGTAMSHGSTAVGTRAVLRSFERAVGSPKADVIGGGPSTVRLAGGGGDDVLVAAAKAVLDGGAGNDTADFQLAATGVSADLAQGTAAVAGGRRVALIRIEGLSGSAHADTLAGTPGAKLDGAAGDDTLAGRGTGADLVGGPGRDTASYRDAGEAMAVDLGRGTAQPKASVARVAQVTGDALAGIEDVDGSAFPDLLVGDAGPNNLEGNGGADEVRAGGGDDRLEGGIDDDSLYGEEGDDSLLGGAGDDLIDGGPGRNVCEGGEGDDTLTVSCDGAAPELAALTIDPASIDTADASRTITVRARITDDLSGNAGPGYTSSPSQIRFRSPSGTQFVDALLSGTERTAGTPQDGEYEYVITVPRFAEQGTWTIQYALLVDQVGNQRSLTVNDLAAKSFPTAFEQTGAGDTQAPTIASFSMSPLSVDTSTAARTITVSARILDDLSGNAGDGYTSSPSQVRLRSPSGTQLADAMLAGPQRVSGTPQDGIYEFELVIPRYSEQGVWTVDYLLLVDQVGNTRSLKAADLTAGGWPSGFDQVGPGDADPPALAQFSLSPANIDTQGSAQTITVTAQITDAVAGNAGAGYTSSPSQVRFTSTSGNQFVDGLLGEPQRVSGTANDGTYSYEMQLPQFAECGTWTVSYLMLVDQVGNRRDYTAAQLSTAGFPASFTNC